MMGAGGSGSGGSLCSCGTRGEQSGEIETDEGERLSHEKQGRKGQPLEDQNRDSIEAKGDPNQNPGLTKFANVETYTDTQKKVFLLLFLYIENTNSSLFRLKEKIDGKNEKIFKSITNIFEMPVFL